jgi:hypothetical protein
MTPARPFLLLLALGALSACSLVNDPTKLEPDPDASRPATPQSLTARPGNARMNLAWSPVTDWDIDHYVAYFAPTGQTLMKAGTTTSPTFSVEPLDNATAYDFMVLAVDRFGNVSENSEIVTAQPDGVAPTVAITYNPGPQSPANKMTDVIFTFSEPMDQASVTSNVTVTASGGNTPVCVWSWYTDGTEAKCDLVLDGDPSKKLADSTTYHVIIAAGAVDPAGNALVGSPVDASFTTAVADDVVAPALTSVTVSNHQSAAQPVGTGSPGAQGVFPETDVVITFSEPMKPLVTEAAISVTAGPGYNGGQKSWDATGTVLTFNPDVNYAYGQTVTVTFGAGIADASGNPLPATASRTFRIASSASVTLESVPSRDGYAYSSGSSVTVNAGTSYLAVGDSSLNYQYKGFVSFDRNALPANLTRFTAASLGIDQYSVTGTPYDDLDQSTFFCIFNPITHLYTCFVDDLLAYHVSLDATGTAGLDPGDFAGASITGAVEIATSPALGYWSANVLTAVEDDRASARRYSEWRLEFPVATDGAGDTDLAYFYAGEGSAGTRPTLTLTYEYY